MTDLEVRDDGGGHVPTLIVAVDPGTSVGIAALLDGRPVRVYQIRLDTPDGRDRLRAALAYLFDLGRNLRLLVACERYTTQGRAARLSRQDDAQDVIGLVKTLSPVEVALQSSADAARFASDARLNALGLWVVAAEVHQPDADDANSAMRHALLLLARRCARTYVRLLEENGVAPTAST